MKNQTFTLLTGCLLCLLVLSSTFLQVVMAQNTVEQEHFGTGALLASPEQYDTIPLTPPIAMRSSDKLPSRYSLKRFCPTPGNQFNTATCVGWSAAYGVRTMIEAMYNNWDNTYNQAIIDENAFSPSFVYNQIVPSDEHGKHKSKCDIGAYILEALHFMKRKGTVYIKDFPFDGQCESRPDEDLQEEGKGFTIKNYTRINFSDQDNAKVRKTRESLVNNMPVIIAMEILHNFKYGDHTNYIWNPEKGNKQAAGAHAMVVVGYDDELQLFEILNSWGTQWGNKGFLHIPYDVFQKYVKEMYQIMYDFPKPIQQEAEPVVTIEPAPILAGKHLDSLSALIRFEQLETHYSNGSIDCTDKELGIMKVKMQKEGYKMQFPNTDWTAYRIYLSPQTQNMAVYAFSIDANNEVNLLYPFPKEIGALYGVSENSHFSATLPYQKGQLAIPHEQYCMQLDDQKGTINCFLFSKKELSINEILKDIQQSSGTLANRLKKALGNNIAPSQTVQYSAQEIGFSANVPDGKVIPIIVDMNHVR